MSLQELLQLLGAKEVDLHLARKRIAELEQIIKNLTSAAPVESAPKTE